MVHPLLPLPRLYRNLAVFTNLISDFLYIYCTIFIELYSQPVREPRCFVLFLKEAKVVGKKNNVVLSIKQ